MGFPTPTSFRQRDLPCDQEAVHLKRIASFDIFDTLLTRKVASPASLFLILGERAAQVGLTRVSASTFHQERIRAEEEGRVSAPGREVQLAEIHRLLAAKLGLTPQTGEALAALEMVVEDEFLVPVPGALNLVSRARGWSAAVLFVSDMYLPASFLRDQLSKNGFWQEGDRLFVSSEWRLTKAAGSLFRKVMEQEQFRPGQIYHLGDREDSDVSVPAKLGIKAQQWDVCRLTRYEEMLEKFSVESGGFSSLVAGISRLTRLQSPAASRHLATLSGIASSLISPIIVCYALWLLREAKKRKLQRLYFVARDGYLVKRITDALIRVFSLPLETRYLYGSRQAWHLPAITEFSGEALSWLFERTRTLNLRIVLGRLQMTPEQIADILPRLGWPESAWDQPLDEKALDRLKVNLLGDAPFREQVEMTVVEKRNLATAYLEQEGLFDSTAWAMVDLGWHGRLQQSLEKLLGLKKPTPILGLYFGLYADSPALAQVKVSSYLNWDLRHPPEGKDIPSLVFLMESFCTAPHGSTVGYHRDGDGRMTPQCRENGFALLESWGIATVHSTVDAFAKKLEELALPVGILDWDSRPALVEIFQAFSTDPLPVEARAWGTFPYEDEQSGNVRERLTMPYEITWGNLRTAFTFGEERYLPASWKVLWHGGQPHVRSWNTKAIKLAMKLGRLKKRLGRLLRRHP